MSFQKINRQRTLITGALENETGSELLFGYRPEDQKLEYLADSTETYNPATSEWEEAQHFLARVYGPEHGHLTQAPLSDDSHAHPRTVTRSVIGSDELRSPEPGDSRIVGSLDDSGIDYGEDAMANRAVAFLTDEEIIDGE